MVFSSVVFLFYFLAPLLAVYFLVDKKYKNIVLFIASLVFYAWGEPKYILLMLFSAFFNYLSGIVINGAKQKKLFLFFNVLVNIGILVFFKYSGFICSWVGKSFSIALPIGISFYTFQALSYTIDVYRGNTKVQNSFLKFGLYLSLFPQLIAGPIVRYDDVAKQLDKREITGKKFMQGVTRFCAGMCKKVILANSLGQLWNIASGMEASSRSMGMAWLGIFAFSMQIYFDFSGYSDMAIGLGKMFGFDFLENFNYPYISRSATEFWRRWHISLGSWFREYVYIPLGGNRKGKRRQNINLLIVWMLTGLWHGAEWNFVLWGLYFGVLLIIEKNTLLEKLKKRPFLSYIYSTLVVTFGWVLFAITDIKNVFLYLGSMFNITKPGFTDSTFLYNFGSYFFLSLIAILVSSGMVKNFYDKILLRNHNRIKYIFAIIGFIISIAYLVDATYNPFLYFRF